MRAEPSTIQRGLSVFLAAALVAAAPVSASGQNLDHGDGGTATAVSPRRTLEAVPREGAVRIDGRLEDGAWSKARGFRGFIQGEPVEGVPAQEDTQVWVLFDEEALYVAARMFDSDPASIGTQLVRRDEGGAFDWFNVSLDPNLDQRTGYSFQVSAAGVQSDHYLFSDRQTDAAWNAVWESAVTVDEQGWIAEIRIPLSQIRYDASDDPQTWGINFARRRLSSNETSYFVLRSRLQEGTVSQFGRLHGVQVPRGARRIEARPYVLSSYHRGQAREGDPFFSGQEASARLGTELRVGLGPAFTLDATVNPDFGQVESDPAVINLSAVETFLQERRPFFVEDAQIFDFRLSGMQNQLFYSRRIGRSPQGSVPGGADFQDLPEAASILGAAKLTGRTTGGLSIGGLAAVTQQETGRAFYRTDGRTDELVVEPLTEYGVFRLQQDFNGGASQVGGIVTALHRDLPGDGAFDFLTDQAYSGGVSFEHQWGDRTWALTAFLAGTHVRGDSTALIRVQRSNNHYRQRPDATRQEMDSAATSMSGATWRVQLDRQNGTHWTGGIWLAQVTDGFEANDLGYFQGGEKLDAGARIGYREITPGKLFRSYSLNVFTYHNWSHEALDDWTSPGSWGQAYSQGAVNLMAHGTLLNYWNGNLNVFVSPNHYNFGATRGGPAMYDPGAVNVRAGLNTDGRKAVSYRGNVNYRHGFLGSGGNLSVSGTVSLRPSPRLAVELTPELSTQTDALQYVGVTSAVPFAPTFGRRYLFGDLERRSVSMETRLNVTVTPTLSLQLYAQPLLSSGDYVAFKQLTAARAFEFEAFRPGELRTAGDQRLCAGGQICEERLADGRRRQHVDFDGDGAADHAFIDPDFNLRSLIGNAVIRWEYRPGSTVFLVWQRRQSERLATGSFDFARDAGGLFDAPSDDRFILKVNYWLGL